MNLAEYSSRHSIFIDANIFLDYTLPNTEFGKAVSDFLERVELQDVAAITTPAVLNEVSYILLLQRGMAILNTGNRDIVRNKIKANSHFAHLCYDAVDTFNEFISGLDGLKLIPVQPEVVSKADWPIGEFMKPKVSTTERLIGSIQLDDQKLIDEIIESEIWNYDEDLECMADWPSDSEKSDHDEATAPDKEKHTGPIGESLSPIDEVRQWQSQNPGKGDYSKERSPACDLRIDEILQGIKRTKKEKARGSKV